MKARLFNGSAEKICLGYGIDYAILVNIRWMRASFEFSMMNKIAMNGASNIAKH